ncbi:putative O-acetyltransferase [Schizophyllum fasciatum]
MAAQSKAEDQVALARTLNNTPWCEEYERMISGMLYNAMAPELAKARFEARAWAMRYNTTVPPNCNDADSLALARYENLKGIVGKIADDDIYIEPPFYIDYGCNISFGERFYSNFNLTILDCALVTIGDRVFFGPNVSLCTATHETEVQSRRDNIEYAKPITIGDDCWIGANVVVLPGVTIGKGCTIGAGAVVTRNIPEWSVALGQPARVVKKVTPVD